MKMKISECCRISLNTFSTLTKQQITEMKIISFSGNEGQKVQKILHFKTLPFESFKCAQECAQLHYHYLLTVAMTTTR